MYPHSEFHSDLYRITHRPNKISKIKIGFLKKNLSRALQCENSHVQTTIKSGMDFHCQRS